MKGLASLIPLLSRRHAVRLACLVGWTAHQIDRRGRRLAVVNLGLARQNGRLDISDGEIQSIVRDCYHNFARNFIDLFWCPRLTPENLTEWVDVEGVEAIDAIRNSDRGGILLTPHFGLFEWSSLIVGLLGIQLEVVVRSFRNPLMESVFTNARQASGHKVRDREQVALRLLRSLRRGTSVAMLPDLTIPPQRATATIDMFGKKTTLSTLPAELAIRCSTPIVAAICEPLAHGRAKLKVLKVIDPGSDNSSSPDAVQHYTQAIWDVFEKEIRRRPDCWLWMYEHWRFSTHTMNSRAHSASAADTAVKCKAA